MAKRAKIMKVSDEGTVEWEVEKEEPPVTQSDSKPKLVSIEPKNEICGTPQYRPEPPAPTPVAPTPVAPVLDSTPIQPPAAPKKPSRAEIRKQKDQEKRKKEQIQKMQEARKRKREEAAAKKEQELEEKILQRLMARQQKQRVEYGRQGYQPVPKPQQPPPPPPPPSRASSSNYQPEFVAGGRKRGQHNVHYEDDYEEETDMEDESSEEEGQYEAYAQYEDREPKEWKYTSKPLTRESPAARVPKLQNLIFRRV